MQGCSRLRSLPPRASSNRRPEHCAGTLRSAVPVSAPGAVTPGGRHGAGSYRGRHRGSGHVKVRSRPRTSHPRANGSSQIVSLTPHTELHGSFGGKSSGHLQGLALDSGPRLLRSPSHDCGVGREPRCEGGIITQFKGKLAKVDEALSFLTDAGDAVQPHRGIPPRKATMVPFCSLALARGPTRGLDVGPKLVTSFHDGVPLDQGQIVTPVCCAEG